MVDETTRVDDPAQFPPQEDTVERLWTPQRMTYVLRNDEGKVTKPKTKECRSARDRTSPTPTA